LAIADVRYADFADFETTSPKDSFGLVASAEKSGIGAQGEARSLSNFSQMNLLFGARFRLSLSSLGLMVIHCIGMR
jgi:hypothetical protein